jgi:hypothetical protein
MFKQVRKSDCTMVVAGRSDEGVLRSLGHFFDQGVGQSRGNYCGRWSANGGVIVPTHRGEAAMDGAAAFMVTRRITDDG